MAPLVDEIIELLAQDANELGVREELRHARTIVAEGTSAHRQIASYQAALEAGSSNHEALQAVVDELIVDTMHGIQGD